jgi:hypothetical protein
MVTVRGSRLPWFMVPNPIDLGFKLVFFGPMATPSNTLAASICDTKNDKTRVVALDTGPMDERTSRHNGEIRWDRLASASAIEKIYDHIRPTTTFTLMTGDWTEFDHHNT